MDFLILRPLSLKTGNHFLGGGVWWGGGSKVFAEKAPSSGEAEGCHTVAGRMVTQQTVAVKVGGSSPGFYSVFDRGGDIFGRPGFEPPTKKSAACVITIRPLLHWGAKGVPTACARVCH